MRGQRHSHSIWIGQLEELTGLEPFRIRATAKRLLSFCRRLESNASQYTLLHISILAGHQRCCYWGMGSSSPPAVVDKERFGWVSGFNHLIKWCSDLLLADWGYRHVEETMCWKGHMGLQIHVEPFGQRKILLDALQNARHFVICDLEATALRCTSPERTTPAWKSLGA